MTRMLSGIVVLAAAVAVGAGCGDDDDKAPSKAEYVKRANAICERFERQLDRQAEKDFAGIESESDLTTAKARGFFEVALPRYRQAVKELKALDPPEGDEQAVAEIYAAGERDAESIERSLGDEAKVKALVTGDSVTPRFDRLASRYGLDTCGQG